MRKNVKRVAITTLALTLVAGAAVGYSQFTSKKDANASNSIEASNVKEGETAYEKAGQTMEEYSKEWAVDFGNSMKGLKDNGQITTGELITVYNDKAEQIGLSVEVLKDGQAYGSVTFDYTQEDRCVAYENVGENAQTLFNKLAENLGGNAEKKLYAMTGKKLNFAVVNDTQAAIDNFVVDRETFDAYLTNEYQGAEATEAYAVDETDTTEIADISIQVAEAVGGYSVNPNVIKEEGDGSLVAAQKRPIVNCKDKVVGYAVGFNSGTVPFGYMMVDFSTKNITSEYMINANVGSKYDELEKALGEEADGKVYVFGDRRYAVVSADGDKACVAGLIVDKAEFDRARALYAEIEMADDKVDEAVKSQIKTFESYK